MSSTSTLFMAENAQVNSHERKITELMDQKHSQLGHEQPKPTPQGRKDPFRDRKAEILLGKRRL